MRSETGKVRLQNAECGGCRGCTGPSQVPAGGLEGFRLVACAFVVFVAPLVLAVVGAGIGLRYGGSLVWSVLAALSAWILGVAVARLVTRALKPQGPSEDHCGGSNG